MELWFMECVAFGCIAVGVCSIVSLFVRAFIAVCKWQRDEAYESMEKENKALREQVDGLRSNLERKDIELRDAFVSRDKVCSEYNRLLCEITALKRDNK